MAAGVCVVMMKDEKSSSVFSRLLDDTDDWQPKISYSR